MWNYFIQVRQELEKVSWPSRKQTTDMTVLVIAVSLFLGLYVGGLDFILAKIMAWIF